jgi:hypothetical protein
MTDEDFRDYYSLIPADRRSRVNSEAVWQLNMGAFVALQEIRQRLELGLLREASDTRRQEVARVVQRIEQHQARLSLRLMECDFERWQEIIKPDFEQWSSTFDLFAEYGEPSVATDLKSIVTIVRVLVHTEKSL